MPVFTGVLGDGTGVGHFRRLQDIEAFLNVNTLHPDSFSQFCLHSSTDSTLDSSLNASHDFQYLLFHLFKNGPSHSVER